MFGVKKLIEISILLNLMILSNSNEIWGEKNKLKSLPKPCNKIECPNYELIEEGNGFQIRRHDSPVWISTSIIHDISIVQAGRTAFYQLFDYIQGKNKYNQKMDMTAPVITQVLPSDGPFCESSFIVSFFIPKEFHVDPPPAEGKLHIQKWGPTYVAVRQFSGFVTDYNVGQEAAALQSSLAGSKWEDAIQKTRGDDPKSSYTVAQYNSPFEFVDRVNEIWFSFDPKVLVPSM